MKNTSPFRFLVTIKYNNSFFIILFLKEDYKVMEVKLNQLI